MRVIRTLSLLCVLLGVAAALSMPEVVSEYIEREISKRTPPSCSGKWQELKDSSTMCRFEDSSSAKDCGVTEADKKVILETHNRLRSKVSPSSSNMMKMYWNDDLAVVAQKWAKQCLSAHDTNENRQIPGTGKDMFIGQSWASGPIFKDWRSAVEDGWYSEVKFFSYGSSYHRGVVGHYTQVVRDQANLIGCGKCSCSQGPVYICNYYQGNSQDTGHPYKSGTPCADCKTCVDGLCDCGTTMCKNNGTLNSKTCKCECPGKWSGADCMEYQCPDKDGDGCGDWFTKDQCDMYFNVPDECPHMCGLCKGGGGGGNGGNNGGNGGGNDAGQKVTASCKDTNQMCPEWAKWGECDGNPGYMLVSCKKSCNKC